MRTLEPTAFRTAVLQFWNKIFELLGKFSLWIFQRLLIFVRTKGQSDTNSWTLARDLRFVLVTETFFGIICATNTLTFVSRTHGIYIGGIDEVMMWPPTDTSSNYVVVVYVFCGFVHLRIFRQLCELAYTLNVQCGRMIFSYELRIIWKEATVTQFKVNPGV
jgi:hypothetical protein